MRVWRRVAVICLLVAGCGGPALDEGPPSESVGSELGSAQERPGPVANIHPVPNAARLVKELFPDSPIPWYGPYPENLVAYRGRLYFRVTSDASVPGGLWTSDGTEAGTVQVTGAGTPYGLTVAVNRLFFTLDDGVRGNELWVSDGTAAGTRLVKDLAPGSGGSSLELLGANSRGLLFLRVLPGATPELPRAELWRSNGTEAGTVRVRDLGTGVIGQYAFTTRLVVGDTLYFFDSAEGYGLKLWRSDGTTAGTAQVYNIHGSSRNAYARDLRAVGNTLYFIVSDYGRGHEVWKSNGTTASTARVESIARVPDTQWIWMLEAIGGDLYYALPNRDRTLQLRRLRTDCTGSGCARSVATLPNPHASLEFATPFITTQAVAEGKLFFSLGISSSGPAPIDVQLWVTDGTSAGTKLLHRPLSLGDEFSSELYAIGRRVIFTGASTTYGGDLEPWDSTGSVSGTRKLQDIAPGGASSFARDFTRVGNSLFFVANDGVHGNELWVFPLE
jgi:ELWxxDGT repeat protein